MATKQNRHARRKRWAKHDDHVPAKAKKGRVLEGAERDAAVQRLADSKREVAEAARKVANATVKVDRRLEQRMTSTPGNKPFAGRSRGIGNALSETDARNSLAAEIAERRAREAERLQMRMLQKTADADEACKRAWENRLDVRPIIERELKRKQDV